MIVFSILAIAVIIFAWWQHFQRRKQHRRKKH